MKNTVSHVRRKNKNPKKDQIHMNNEIMNIVIYLISDILTFYCIYLMMKGFLGERRIPIWAEIVVYAGCYVAVNMQYLLL